MKKRSKEAAKLAPARNIIKKDKPTVYVVCQTPRCQQTYPMSYFGVVTKDTKNVPCPKCGGILIDKNGRANFSQNPWVIPGISIKELEDNNKAALKRKREEQVRLEKEIQELEEELSED